MIEQRGDGRLNVVKADGIWKVEYQPGGLVPLLNGGIPVSDFNFGWSPLCLIDFGAKVSLLELRYHDGHRATWFMDRQLNRLGDNIVQLASEFRDDLLDIFFVYLNRVYTELLGKSDASAPEMAYLMSYVCAPTMSSIVHAILPRIAPNLVAIGLAAAPAGNFCPRALDGNLQDALDAALGGESLTWPSPLDGSPQKTSHSIPVDEHRIGYRFQDLLTGTIFYLGATHLVFQASDIFIPAMQTVLFGTDRPYGRDDAFQVAADYLTHAAIHARAIVGYITATQRNPAVIVRGYPGMHIGHHIWNELTALHRLQERLPPDRLPRVYIPDSDHGSEPFAPVETILPAFDGLIDRTHAYRKETLGSLTYREGLLLVRAMDEHVAQDLSDRISAATLRDERAMMAAEAANRLRDAGYAIVMLGLRVENRTSADLLTTLQFTIDHFSKHVEKLAIVLDGHNARIGDDPTTCFGSHGQPSTLNALLLEIDLALKIRERYHYTDVKIISTIGNGVPTSVAWCKASDAFVTFWGAGLAKYRWACNTPGLIISSKWNLIHRGDLRIYDLPPWQEKPSPAKFLEPEHVTDRPDLGVYFAITLPVPPSYANFDIALPGLEAGLNWVIETLIPGCRPTTDNNVSLRLT